MKLPSAFIESAAELLGYGEAQRLFTALDTPAPVSVRFNPYKLTEQPEGRRVPWSRYGYYLDERPQFTLDPLFHAGAYYVQEASSMFVEHICRSATGGQERLKILDLCAAPGGKTTLLSTLAGLDSLVVANEVMRPRAMALADNVKKWGLGNVVVTNNDPSHFGEFRDWFDIVLVDAPCSGEGMFRKNPESRAEWSPENVRLCAQRQRRILADIWGALKPGGLLIYSTCTFNRTENEENIEWLAQEYDCGGVGVEVPTEWGVVTGAVPVAGREAVSTFRFYPHRAEGEGFFAAAVRKGGEKARTKTPKARRTVFTDPPKQSLKELARWVNQPEFMYFAQIGEQAYGYYRSVFPAVRTVAEGLSAIYSGVEMGQLFHAKLRPEHPLALFHDLAPGIVPETCLQLPDALHYLRKGDGGVELFTEGMNLVAYEGFPLGWLKRIGHRVNNMYPKELRIVNL